MKTKKSQLSVVLLTLVLSIVFVGSQIGFTAPPTLVYKGESASAVPVLAGEKGLQTVTAEPWLKVSDKSLQLEGLIFDRDKNLYFLEVFGGQVFRLTLSDKKVTTVIGLNKMNPAAVKIHKDGRLFLCNLGDFKTKGSVVAFQPDGTNPEVIIPESAGYLVDDMVFDSTGGFYFTDFKGYSTNPAGGVYYVSPDFQTITPILQNMAIANGIALSTNEKTLWTTELGANKLHSVALADRTTIAPFGATIPYYFSGATGPDSAMIDADDNLYVAMYNQGKVLAFNKYGNPIGQILIPGRDDGHMLRSTAMAIIPGTNQIIICANDGSGNGGSWLYTANVFGKDFEGQFQYKK